MAISNWVNSKRSVVEVYPVITICFIKISPVVHEIFLSQSTELQSTVNRIPAFLQKVRRIDWWIQLINYTVNYAVGLAEQNSSENILPDCNELSPQSNKSHLRSKWLQYVCIMSSRLLYTCPQLSIGQSSCNNKTLRSVKNVQNNLSISKINQKNKEETEMWSVI